jgi:GINS complex subunit 1
MQARRARLPVRGPPPLRSSELCRRRSARADRIRDLVWGAGLVTTSDMLVGLTESELRYLDDYRRLVIEYGRSRGVDLSEDPQPPKTLLVTVEVARGVGAVDTSRGTVVLKAGTRHLMPRRDAEVLVRSGHLRLVPGRDNF